MSVCIPCLRRAPARGPSQKRARRDQDCVRAPRADGCRRRAASSVCGSVERAADGRGGTASSRFSRSIPDACGLTRGHPGIELRRRPPLDPLRCDPAPTSRVLATGEISPASFPVSAPGGPTRRTACSFSLAVSLWRCRSATTGLSRPSPVPLSRVCRQGSSLHPGRGPPGEPGGVSPSRLVPTCAWHDSMPA
jgi:hypothetical protein